MIRGVHNYYLCRNHSVLMVLLRIQNDHFSPHIFSLFLCYLIKVLSVYFQYISQTFHSLLKILNIVIQDKCYKPHNQVKFFFQNMFVLNYDYIYMIDFIKAISCSDITHVSAKEMLAVIFAIFST